MFKRFPYMKGNFNKKQYLLWLLLAASTFVVNVAAQQSLAEKEKEFVDGSGDRMWYTMGFVVFASLAAAVFLWRRSRKGKDQPQYNYGSRYQDYYNNQSYDMEGVDAEKELEWLRKAKKSGSGPSKVTFDMKKGGVKRKTGITATNSAGIDEANLDTKIFQEKMRKLQYAQLPINSFSELVPSKKFEILPISDDQSLLNAIEQANEEYEEDESIRELAVKILSAFRTQNSIEALSQIALYDLSANLRSKAVTTLTDFDHESVFEPILLACADPTREVRAAAARGLFRLNFDRADAWKRILETNDEFRMRHAARAAVEAGIVLKAFERLVHDDLKIAYEAFVLVAMLIKAGETEEIFSAIREHRDERVKFALLHVLRSVKDERSLDSLNELRTSNTFPTDVMDRLTDTIKSFEHVPA
ncbi:MAG: HEAT repeat domain-containing protein [Chloracidobacterium sp.]|nr:HEAT repeat domain-containing protein [Chloracidobacterium sp.]